MSRVGDADPDLRAAVDRVAAMDAEVRQLAALAAARAPEDSSSSSSSSSSSGGEGDARAGKPPRGRAVDARTLPAAGGVPLPEEGRPRTLVVCEGKDCARRGAAATMAAAAAVGAARGVPVRGCKCLGECKRAPAVRAVGGAAGGGTFTHVSTPELVEAVLLAASSGAEAPAAAAALR